ncbi:hypothetical protein B7494_g2540 [Chlorociboria aeruginascens]|nr:hypothetical protein B7494_g2540 [Chlorociboria aeruginascens]
MADSSSISAILAALAAQQRPNATPAQNTQPAYQQPPSAQQQQNLYASSSGYLPQPTNSGSVDLSSIKSSNLGASNYQDALAKVRAIAAEKGVSYERPPSYSIPESRGGSGRPYRTSRSRSRSPPARRDAFRDNFNPYRDERRGGDRPPSGRDYRERSFSPGVRGRGTFSPSHSGGAGGYQARERSPIRSADDTSESVSIESNLVGLIIGRQGENLRRVESETGCRVQFVTGPDESGPYRQCKITGPRARRAEAKAEINRIIDDSGMAGAARPVVDRPSRDALPARASSHQPALREGEDSMQIMVPDRTVGLIIGRGGETIRDLQERSGCHVNIVGEQKSVNGLRPVNLIGSREAAARAKDLIMEIVESDSKNVAGKERAPAQRDNTRDSGYGGTGGGDKINDSILVPSDAVGMIIGKGGETIKDMQSTTGCKINVSPSSGSNEVEREIGLVGSREAIAAARLAIQDKVSAVQQKNAGSGGGRNRSTQNDYGDRGYSQQSYTQPQGQSQQGQNQAASTGAEDPYAVYGGYQAYAAMYYQALAQQQQQQQLQQQGGQSQGDSTKPPGTS